MLRYEFTMMVFHILEGIISEFSCFDVKSWKYVSK
jgi:hypothetical protein